MKYLFLIPALVLLSFNGAWPEDQSPSDTPNGEAVSKAQPTPARILPTATVSKNTTPVSRVYAKGAPSITTIPNPARGKKMTFRIMASGPVKVHIKIYNNFMDSVQKLDDKGEGLFDILWSLKNIPEGIYYYQTQIEDANTGILQKLPMQKFVVLK